MVRNMTCKKMFVKYLINVKSVLFKQSDNQHFIKKAKTFRFKGQIYKTKMGSKSNIKMNKLFF